MAEWEHRLNPDAGLCIVFAAKGINGKDVMHPSLLQEMEFRQYTQGDLNNYHISYYANNPKKPSRPFATSEKIKVL